MSWFGMNEEGSTLRPGEKRVIVAVWLWCAAWLWAFPAFLADGSHGWAVGGLLGMPPVTVVAGLVWWRLSGDESNPTSGSPSKRDEHLR